MPCICLNCKKEFTPKYVNKNKYCSLTCYHEYRYKHQTKTRTCPNCKKIFTLPISCKNKCCSRDCDSQYRTGTYNLGSFRLKQKGRNWVPVGTITQRYRTREGYARNWIKISEPNKSIPLAQYVWIQHYGGIKKGYLIHHKDENALNDNIENLQCVTRNEHVKIHMIRRKNEASVFDSTSNKRR